MNNILKLIFMSRGAQVRSLECCRVCSGATSLVRFALFIGHSRLCIYLSVLYESSGFPRIIRRGAC